MRVDLRGWLLTCLATLGLSGCNKHTAEVPRELTVIRPAFPKSVFISSPWDCKLPNFEKPEAVKKAFLAPADTKIVSLNKPVTSSTPPTKGQIGWITDDEAFCGQEGENTVSFETLPCWIQIDLGSKHLIDQVWLWHDQGTLARRLTPEVFEDVIVQLSNDAKFASDVVTLFNSDDDDSCGQGKGTDPTYMDSNHGRGVPAGGQQARYVRIWGGKAYSGGPCRFTEVTVWGR
jgi:hypothetical protein